MDQRIPRDDGGEAGGGVGCLLRGGGRADGGLGEWEGSPNAGAGFVLRRDRPTVRRSTNGDRSLPHAGPSVPAGPGGVRPNRARGVPTRHAESGHAAGADVAALASRNRKGTYTAWTAGIVGRRPSAHVAFAAAGSVRTTPRRTRTSSSCSRATTSPRSWSWRMLCTAVRALPGPTRSTCRNSTESCDPRHLWVVSGVTGRSVTKVTLSSVTPDTSRDGLGVENVASR